MPNIIKLAKSRRIRWAQHAAHMGGERRKVHTQFWDEDLKERNHLEDPDPGRRIIVIFISKKQDVRMWTGFIWLRI
jgi:hypothetical protein